MRWNVIWYAGRGLFRWLMFNRRRRQELAALRHTLKLRDEEILFLREQLESFRDTCSAHQWYQRAAGAEAKQAAEALRGGVETR